MGSDNSSTLHSRSVTTAELRSLYVFLESLGKDSPLGKLMWVIYAQLVKGITVDVSYSPNFKFPARTNKLYEETYETWESNS